MASVAGSAYDSQPTDTASSRGPSRARRLIGFCLLVAVLYLLYMVQSKRIEAFVVTSESMEPTLKVGESYLMFPAERYESGQIAVFLSPEDHGTRLVKRIVALPGDIVQLREGVLFVNDAQNSPPTGGITAIDLADQTWRLHSNEYFLVGDNRTASHDSREFGPVSDDLMLGVLSAKPVSRAWWHRLTTQFVEATF